MSEADPIRVLVVDDQDLVRGGFKAILGTYEGIEIVGEAETGPMRCKRPSAFGPTWCSWTSACPK